MLFPASNDDVISLFLTDIVAAAFSFALCQSVIALILLLTRITGLYDLHLTRKLIHIYTGLTVMLYWPMFSSSWLGTILAGLIPCAYITKCLSGVKEDKRLLGKLSGRYRDYWHIIDAAAGYVVALFLVTVIYWRSPIAIATVSNVCAGDGVADIVGRRFGSWKLPYNNKKSFAGSIGMAVAGFLASIGFMYYFSWFGYIKGSRSMALGFLVVSIASALVESHPLSIRFDDNWTVPIVAILVGNLVF